MILLGLGCFLIATKNNQYNFFEDILSRYPEENIAGTLMVDFKAITIPNKDNNTNAISNVINANN